MKRVLCIIMMITCLLGLSACGSEETLSEYDASKVAYAETLAETLTNFFCYFMDDSTVSYFDNYTAEEVAYLCANSTAISSAAGLNFNAEGYAVLSAITSFYGAADDFGELVSIDGSMGEIDDDQIIVTVYVTGTKKSAEAEIILSNDMFMTLESAALNPVSTTGELMGKAALNTLIGMGLVFAVLILISCIISCFAFIPKIQAAFAKKPKEQPGVAPAAPAAASAPAPVAEVYEEADDLELIAVIAAAIAASQGQTSTDGFVVRSIKKRTRAARW